MYVSSLSLPQRKHHQESSSSRSPTGNNNNISSRREVFIQTTTTTATAALLGGVGIATSPTIAEAATIISNEGSVGKIAIIGANGRTDW